MLATPITVVEELQAGIHAAVCAVTKDVLKTLIANWNTTYIEGFSASRFLVETENLHKNLHEIAQKITYNIYIYIYVYIIRIKNDAIWVHEAL